METILVKPKNKNEFEFISELLKRMQVKMKMLNIEDIEDLGMIKLMKEADRTEKVSKDKILAKLGKK